ISNATTTKAKSSVPLSCIYALSTYTSDTYTLSLHDALPISHRAEERMTRVEDLVARVGAVVIAIILAVIGRWRRITVAVVRLRWRAIVPPVGRGPGLGIGLITRTRPRRRRDVSIAAAARPVGIVRAIGIIGAVGTALRIIGASAVAATRPIGVLARCVGPSGRRGRLLPRQRLLRTAGARPEQRRRQSDRCDESASRPDVRAHFKHGSTRHYADDRKRSMDNSASTIPQNYYQSVADLSVYRSIAAASDARPQTTKPGLTNRLSDFP